MNTGLRYKYSETFYQTSFANQLKSLFLKYFNPNQFFLNTENHRQMSNNSVPGP